jgi:hypothetical protein
LDKEEKVVTVALTGCAGFAELIVISMVSVVGLFVYGLGRVVGAW